MENGEYDFDGTPEKLVNIANIGIMFTIVHIANLQSKSY